MDATDELKDIGGGSGYTIVEYREALYKVTFVEEPWSATAKILDIDITKYGEQMLDGEKFFVTPNGEDGILHRPIDNGILYYLKENGKDLDLSRTVTETIYYVNNKYCNSSEETVNVIAARGPISFYNMYYFKDNEGNLDKGRPFSEGYGSNSNPNTLGITFTYGTYYDTSGKLVNVGRSASQGGGIQ